MNLEQILFAIENGQPEEILNIAFLNKVKQAILDAEGDGGAVELEYPEFHAQGMGCGLEDRGITDRYEAMRYGFDEALDQMSRIIENAGPLYTHPAPPASPAEVPDGGPSVINDALAVLKDVAQFHGQLPVGIYQHIQPRLAALLAAAPSAPEGDGGGE